MSFGLNERERIARDLAGEIFRDSTDQDRLAKVEASSSLVDEQLWKRLAGAGLLGLALGEDVGGAGGDFTEQVLVLEQQGRVVAPVPLAPTAVAALAVDTFGSRALRDELLPGVVAGDHIATVALSGTVRNGRPPVSAHPADGGAWRLDGVELCVPAATVASWMLVPAVDPDGVAGLYVVGGGVEVTAAATTDRQNHGHPRLSATPARRLGGPDAVEWAVQRLTIANCAVQCGVARTAVELAASYVAGREQFGRPLSAFQAVLMRAADASIAVEVVQATTYAAAQAASGRADVGHEVAVAKWWASTAGVEAVESALHLHGGAGNLLDYRLALHYLWAKQNATSLGGGAQQLRNLGVRLAGSGRAAG